jgi:hypothetical protein
MAEQYMGEQYMAEQYMGEQYIAGKYIAEQHIAEQYMYGQLSIVSCFFINLCSFVNLVIKIWMVRICIARTCNPCQSLSLEHKSKRSKGLAYHSIFPSTPEAFINLSSHLIKQQDSDPSAVVLTPP